MLAILQRLVVIRKEPARMARWIWQAKSGNGWRTGIVLPIISARQPRILWLRIRVNIGRCAAARGSSRVVTCGLRSGVVLRIQTPVFVVHSQDVSFFLQGIQPLRL